MVKSCNNKSVLLACALYCIFFVLICSTFFVGIKHFFPIMIVSTVSIFTTFIYSWLLKEKISKSPFIYLSFVFILLILTMVAMCIVLAR